MGRSSSSGGGGRSSSSSSIPSPKWPESAPSKHEEKVMSIVCGNTHLHWAIHEGQKHSFVPVLFWRTPPLQADEKDDDPCQVLARHLPKQAHEIVFGEEEAQPSKIIAASVAARRRVPAIAIYVISTNKDQESALPFLFQDVPYRMYKLNATDFFSKEDGVYDGLGVDRVATLKAAVDLHQTPVLVFDAGTALTYTGMNKQGKIMGGGISPGINSRFRAMHDYCGNLPIIEFRDCQKVISEAVDKHKPLPTFAKGTKTAMMVDVFSEVAGKCRAVIKHFMEQVKKDDEKAKADAAKAKAVSTPVSATSEAAPAAAATNNTSGTADVTMSDQTNGETNAAAATSSATTTSAAAPADADASPPANAPAPTPASTSSSDPAQPQKPTMSEERRPGDGPAIALTGGDSVLLERLLAPNHSYLVPPEPGATMPSDEYSVIPLKHLIHYGIAACIKEKAEQITATSPENELRIELTGQRVAKKFSMPDFDGDTDYRGTIVSIRPHDEVNIEKDWFFIRYDDGDTEHYDIVQLYDALLLYKEVGEKSVMKTSMVSSLKDKSNKDGSDDATKSTPELDFEQKSKDSKKSAEALLAKSKRIQQELEDRKSGKSKIPTPTAPPHALSKVAPPSSSGTNTSVASRSALAEAASTGKRGNTGTSTTPANKRRKKDNTPSSTPASQKKKKKPAQDKKTMYLKKRVAKAFEQEDENGKLFSEIYYGTIDSYVEGSDAESPLWHVTYDDDDEEEYDEKDIKKGLKLYAREMEAKTKKTSPPKTAKVTDDVEVLNSPPAPKETSANDPMEIDDDKPAEKAKPVAVASVAPEKSSTSSAPQEQKAVEKPSEKPDDAAKSVEKPAAPAPAPATVPAPATATTPAPTTAPAPAPAPVPPPSTENKDAGDKTVSESGEKTVPPPAPAAQEKDKATTAAPNNTEAGEKSMADSATPNAAVATENKDTNGNKPAN